MVPLPPPVRRRAARPARCPSTRTGSPSCTGPPAAGTPSTACSADAVTHALAGGDAERAADLVELALPDLRRRRQDRTLREWLRALPDEVVRRRPLLATFLAWTRLSEGDLDGVEAWLDAADQAFDAVRPAAT